MKGKTILCLAVVLSMVLTTLPAAMSSPTTSMEVLFVAINDVPITPTSHLIGPPPMKSDNITVAIHITDVVDLWSWKVRLTWDNTMLEILDKAQGEFHPPAPTLFLGVPNQAAGEIPELSDTSIAVPKQGVTGSGNLAYIRFNLFSNPGECYVRALDVIGLNDAGDSITIDPITQGHLELPPPPPTPPIARFTPEHSTFVYVCENVTLDARMSEGGWDTVPEAGEYCPIVEYKWEIDEGCDGSIEYTLYDAYLVDAYHCEAPGDVCINLTVYAPDPTDPDTHPDYYPYDTETHTIHQITRPLGPAIDVYTDRGGEGPGYDETHTPYPYKTSWSDAYGPQEEVLVCAKVTYNDEPVEHKLVAFEVKDPTGTTRLTRTAFTNEEGIACVTFRIPWEGGAAEDMFGAWAIIGTVDIAGDVVDDICKFKFGYILNIAEVIITGSPLYKGDDLSVSVDIDNLSWNSQDTYLTIVLYDECGVPIGMATDDVTVMGEDGMSPIYTITIPTWAFVGTGLAYSNLFTAAPSAGGTPWCPEDSGVFVIEKTP